MSLKRKCDFDQSHAPLSTALLSSGDESATTLSTTATKYIKTEQLLKQATSINNIYNGDSPPNDCNKCK